MKRLHTLSYKSDINNILTIYEDEKSKAWVSQNQYGKATPASSYIVSPADLLQQWIDKLQMRIITDGRYVDESGELRQDEVKAACPPRKCDCPSRTPLGLQMRRQLMQYKATLKHNKTVATTYFRSIYLSEVGEVFVTEYPSSSPPWLYGQKSIEEVIKEHTQYGSPSYWHIVNDCFVSEGCKLVTRCSTLVKDYNNIATIYTDNVGTTWASQNDGDKYPAREYNHTVTVDSLYQTFLNLDFKDIKDGRFVDANGDIQNFGILPESKKKCDCPSRVLLLSGCKCGGI